MRTYESIFIVHPEVVGDSLTEVTEKFKSVLTEQNATILKTEDWGSRKLAYPVKKQNRGTFILMIFDAEAEVIAEFERRLRIDENIIKFQTILLENGYQVEAPVQEDTSAESSEEGSETPAAEEA